MVRLGSAAACFTRKIAELVVLGFDVCYFIRIIFCFLDTVPKTDKMGGRRNSG